MDLSNCHLIVVVLWVMGSSYCCIVLFKSLSHREMRPQHKQHNFKMIFFRRLVGRLPAEGEVGATVEKKRCNEIEPGSKFVRVHTFNPKDSNTVVTNYYQVRCKLSLSSNTGQL